MLTSSCALGGLAGATLAGIGSDRLFRRSPTASLLLAAGALAALGIGFAVPGYSPNIAVFVVIGTQGMTFAGLVPLSLVVAAVTPPNVRAMAFALVGLLLALVGGLGGTLVLGVAEGFWGAQGGGRRVAPLTSVATGAVRTLGARHL